MQDQTLIQKSCGTMPIIRMLIKINGYRFCQGLALILLCVLIGCDRTSMMKKMIPAQDATLAEHYIDAIRLKQYETVEQHADSSITGPDLRNSLSDLAAIFPDPAEEPSSMKPVAINLLRKAGGVTNTSITLEYEFSDEWVLAEVTSQKVNGVVTITGLHAKSIPESVETQNGFSLADKGTAQYFVLFLAVAAPIFTLYALVLCIKTRIEKRKWLWIVFILVGVGKLTVNWTTGQMYVTPLAFQIISGGAMALGYAPWMIYVSLPIGAIIFLANRDSISTSSNAPLQLPNCEPGI
jgi:hypothetical protein